MRIRKTLHPRQRGTKKLVAEYGDRLVCVRYRYDEQYRKRLKTVELIVEEEAWVPSSPPLAGDTIVSLRVALSEAAIRSQVKGAGGMWNPQRRVWELRYDRVVALGLERRIVEEAGSYM
jgi:hypothetical protein